MTIFDGKKHAEYLEEIIKAKLALKRPVGELLIVLIGNNPASEKYVGLKTRLCEKLGIPTRSERIDPREVDEVIFENVKNMFLDPKVSGGIIQLPLPRKSLDGILDLIPEEKDIDCISSKNIERIASKDYSHLSPVLRSTLYFLSATSGVSLQGNEHYAAITTAVDTVKRLANNTGVTVLGNGFLIGEPIFKILSSLGFNVSCNINYRSGDKIDSDLLILGTGVPNLVKGQDISANCNVIDFGTSLVEGKVVGDLDRDSRLDHLGLVSLSPGGVGPLVLRFLLLNYLGY